MKGVAKIIEIRWINSDVLRLNGVDGLLAKKKKKVRIVARAARDKVTPVTPGVTPATP